ncbi:sugar phosphate nucleotidyltransferase [Serratia nevei]|uniref:sugar phosphate nucleotidyltransferase n=1 Tax=Serratia nevei TaxID=2703794 RepID=UPI002E1901D6|nr:sugar phosphate nucleotidyltransferase [Serratia nevei]
MKHQHGRESAGMIFITRFMNSFLHQASFATGYWYYDRHRSVRLVILVGLAIDQIAQSGLSSLSVIYYSAQLFSMIAEFEAHGRSQIMVEPVPEKDVSKYGVVDCHGVAVAPGKSVSMHAIVEKPSQEEAPSNLAVVGRYVLTADIWPLLEKTPYGAGGEIQLTDAIAMLMEQEPVEAFAMVGRSHDCGDKLGYMKAFVEYGLRHPTQGEAFSSWLKDMLQD